MEKINKDVIAQLPEFVRFEMCKAAISDAVLSISNVYSIKALDIAAILRDVSNDVQRAQYDTLISAYYNMLSDAQKDDNNDATDTETGAEYDRT